MNHDNSTSKATARPWRINSGVRVIASPDGFYKSAEHPHFVVAQCSTYCSPASYEEEQANTALIVEAVNSYDRHRETIKALVEALEGMQAACDEWAAEFVQRRRAMNWRVVNDAYISAERALAHARKENK